MFAFLLLAQSALIPAGSAWRYLDDGSDQGVAWTAPSFPDSGWAVGDAQLGYGDGDEVTIVSYGPNPADKYVTTYFRHAFTVPNPATLLGLKLRLLRDDGARVWINGVEVLRENLPAGAVGHRTYAVDGVAGSAESQWHERWLPTATLTAGVNVIAVEVHQVEPDSSDISFDLELLDEAPPPVLRGPYLQRTCHDRAVVRWLTPLPVAGVVRWGAVPGQPTHSAAEPAPVVEHEIEIAGLAADSIYYYSVGDAAGAVAGGDALHFLRTLPAPGSAAPFRAWLLGDVGTGYPEQLAVRNAFLAWSAADPPLFAMLLGDNAYSSGLDSEYADNFFAPYASVWRGLPFWPARGNHDSSAEVYQRVMTAPEAAEAGGLASGTESWYSFDCGDAHFVVLDTAYSSVQAAGQMASWLQADLAATDKLWKIAAFHHPPYTRGSHDSDDPFDSDGIMVDVREQLVPILEAGGVDLVFSGHSHSYERSALIRGHVGFSWTFGPQHVVDGGDGRPLGDGPYRKFDLPDSGTVYVVAGSSGKFSSGTWDHPALPYSHAGLGSLALDVAGDRVEVTLVDASGLERDRFAMIKRRLPRLQATPLLAGQTMTLTLDRCAPGARIAMAASMTGGGPWNSPLGEVALTPPLRVLARGAADAAGAAVYAVTLPPGLLGATIWFQGIEWTGPAEVLTSNGVSDTVR